jgi:FlaA1/EpsC-like NDP-sugar epimerase
MIKFGVSVNIFKLIGRTEALFLDDLENRRREISELVQGASFLVVGGAGSIGQAVVKEIFKRNPKALHVIDISENNLVELVRDIRSTLGYNRADFRTFAIDYTSREFEVFFGSEGRYDYVFNLSALKHVRSEKDPYTLMRMLEVNVVAATRLIRLSKSKEWKKYFCVSTDKAANPVNLMGASKRIMELFAMRESLHQDLAMARFANVAFSDGSLLHGFNQRFVKRQPISAPKDVRRYFLSPQESGELCLLAAIFGNNRDIFFPKLDSDLFQTTFSEIAKRFVESRGFEPVICDSEAEARAGVESMVKDGKWPCYFFDSDTTGEKEFEEFYTTTEKLDLESFNGIGVIRNDPDFNPDVLERFTSSYLELRKQDSWNKKQIVELYLSVLPNLAHEELDKYLDERM